MKVLLVAISVLSLAACTAPPQCIKSHDEQKVGYHYGYGMVYSCTTTYYNNKPKTNCGYGYGYGYVYGSYTETVCDAYASPSQENKD